MKRYFGWIVAALAIAALLPLAPVDVAAQAPAKGGGKAGGKGGEKGKDTLTPTGPTPRMPDGKVDFSGVYAPANFGNYGGPMPLQPWAKQVYDERRAGLSKDDPEGFCLPAGVPRISPFPQKFVQTKDLFVILDEGNVHSYRQIFLDARGHGKGLDNLWMGHSIGTWEGNDTLVVDSVGFNDKTWLNGQGLPHTDKLHVTERYTRPDLGHVNVEITIEDPGALTAPHTFTRVFNLRPDWELLEYVCNEFNIDADRLVGK
jgi:hypothetical protein